MMMLLSKTSYVEPVLWTAPFVKKREEIMHYLFSWCHEEERQMSKFAKNNYINSYQQRVNCNDDKCD